MASVVITGANRGIGLGLVKEFLKDNHVAVLFATTRSAAKSPELSDIRDPRLKIVEMDLDSDDSIRAAAKKVADSLGGKGLDLLLNNSGVLLPVFVDAPFNRKDAAKNFDVNCVGTLLVTQAFLPLLRLSAKAKGQSRIVNISSFLASIKAAIGSTDRGFIAYNMSKAAVNMLTATLATDLKADNIYVTSIEPGWVKTDMGSEAAPLSVEDSTAKIVKSIKSLGKEHNGGFYNFSLEPQPF